MWAINVKISKIMCICQIRSITQKTAKDTKDQATDAKTANEVVGKPFPLLFS